MRGSFSMILEGLNDTRETNKEFDSLKDLYPSEEYEFDEIVHDVSEESIDEAKWVTFGNTMYPKYGCAVIMAGGSGSGKTHTLKNNVAISAKIIDVDRLKELWVIAAKKGKVKDSRGGNYDFKNPNDVGALHQLIKDKDYKNKIEDLFYSNGKETHLGNVVYDITGDDPNKVRDIAKKLKSIGYSTVSLVWVVTNREVAYMRNLNRSRVVPEKIFHETHNNVTIAMEKFLKSADASYTDEAWIVFSSGNSAKDLTPEQKKELENMGVIKLEKNGTSFSIPKWVEEKVHDVLGPQEPNPKNPEKYVKYSDFVPDQDANIAKARSGKLSILKK